MSLRTRANPILPIAGIAIVATGTIVAQPQAPARLAALVLAVPGNPALAQSHSGMENAYAAFRAPSLRNLSATAPYLWAFLRALDDPGFDRTIPPRVPSGLPVGGTVEPQSAHLER
jgi:hypothetical protein